MFWEPHRMENLPCSRLVCRARLAQWRPCALFFLLLFSLCVVHARTSYGFSSWLMRPHSSRFSQNSRIHCIAALFVFACLSFVSVFFLQKGFHFCCYSYVFLNILFFCSHSLISVFLSFLFFALIECMSFLMILCDLVFICLFFSFYILSSEKTKKSVFLMCFSFFFQREKFSFVFSPSSCFSLLQKKDFLFGCSCWLILKLPFFISSLFPSKKTFSTISLSECLLYLFISSFLHPLSTCSLCCLSGFSRFSHLFHPFKNLLSSCSLIVFVFYVSITFLFFCIFVNFCKTHFFCFFSFENLVFVCFFLLLDAFYIFFSCFCPFFLCLQIWFLVFLGKAIFLVWFLSLFIFFWCFWKDVVVFFKRRDIFLVFSFCFFFFSSFSVLLLFGIIFVCEIIRFIL